MPEHHPNNRRVPLLSADDQVELNTFTSDIWQSFVLGDVLDLCSEGIDPVHAQSLSYVGLEHIEPASPSIARYGRASDVRSLKTLFRRDDILYGKLRPYLDKVARADRDGICSTDILVLRSRQIADSGFMALLLHTRAFLAHAVSTTTGVNHPRTSWNSLRVYRLELPPLPEQRAIAHALQTVQRAREQTEAVIAATRELKRSMMRHLFTYGPVPVDQADKVVLKETEIGPVPETWRVVRLGEVADKPDYGYTMSATWSPVGPRFLRITDIQDEKVTWSAVPYCEADSYSAAKYKIEPGDVLIARIGATTGKAYRIKDCPRAVFASYLIRLRAKQPLLSEFLGHFINSSIYWGQINADKGGRLKMGVNIPILKNLLTPIPTMDDQRLIASLLTSLDHKLAAEESRKQAVDTLFKTLLDNLMTGKVRVPVGPEHMEEGDA